MRPPRKIAIGFQEGTCPLKCKKCHAFGENSGGRIKNKSKMDMEVAYALIKEVSDISPRPSIQPHIYTEPFANRDIINIIEKCMEYKVAMSIITNGIPISKEQIDDMIRIMDRNSTISFSLDAITQDTYSKVRGDYSLKEIEKKILYFLDNRKESGPRIGVNFTKESDNEEECDAFLEKWKLVADAVRINIVLDMERKIPLRYRKDDLSTKTKCGYLSEVMVIDTDGSIRKCQFDSFGDTYLGNAIKDGIIKSWNNEVRMKSIADQATGMSSETDFCFDCEACSSTEFIKKDYETYSIVKSNYSFYYNKINT